MKKVIIPAIEILVLTLLITGFFVLVLMWVTAPENWYSGVHDSQHESQNCKCYERLVANAKLRK